MTRLFEVEVPGLRLGRGRNDRLHHHVEAKDVAREHRYVQMAMWGQFKPAAGNPMAQFRVLAGVGPWLVTLTRCAPATAKVLDDDNLAPSAKGVRDEVATWLGVDDGETARVRWAYLNARGPWGVRIEIDLVDQLAPVLEGRPVAAAPEKLKPGPAGWGPIDRTRGGQVVNG